MSGVSGRVGLGRRSGLSGRVVGQRWYTPYLFMVPGLLLYVAMFAWPAVIAIQLAFSDYDIVNPIQWSGLDNFVRLVQDPRVWIALRNSLLFVVMFLPLTVVAPLFLAMLVNVKLRAIQAFRMLYYLPVITSMVAVAVAWKYVFNREGVVNWMLQVVGLGPIDFLLDRHWALPTVVLLEAWKNAGLFMVIYLAGLQAVPSDHVEAAKIDGANGRQRLWHVIVPSLRPTFAVTLILSMLEAMRAFESVYVLTRGGPLDSTLTLGYYIWSKAFEDYDMGYASAVGLVLWAIMIVLAAVNLLVTRRKDV
jgi:putative chitobiose transport system permease protein